MPTDSCPRVLLVLLTLASAAVTSPLRGQDADAALRTFKRDFKPSGKAIELPKSVMSFATNSPNYQSELQRRANVTARWRAAVQGLSGHGTVPVAKAVAAGWVQVERAVAPLWKEQAHLEAQVQRDYKRILDKNDGQPLQPGKRYPPGLIQQHQQWLLLNRKNSELRRDITDLLAMQDELRKVAAAMPAPDGLTWMLESAIGSQQYGLALKVAAVRAASALGEPMLEPMTKALTRARKPDVIAALLLGIGTLGDKAKDSAAQILPLLQHDDAGVRERAALALQHMKIAAAIEPMIALLAREGGQARMRIAGALEILTGQQHGTNIAAWQGWFAKEGAPYAAGEKPLGTGRPSEHRKQDEKNYYGIPQHGKGIIYVIDCSGSMVVDKDNPVLGDPAAGKMPQPARNPQNSRSEASKQELVRAVASLASDQTFNIIWYNHSASLFKKEMVHATPKNKEASKEFVRKLPADSSTNIYEAMRLAFTVTGRGSYDKHYGVEFDTIFLLTDGKPTLQGLGDDDPTRILEGVRKWNPLKRVVIHTIAMGEKGIDHGFMQALASENGGQYRKIVKGGKVVSGDDDKKAGEPQGKPDK